MAVAALAATASLLGLAGVHLAHLYTLSRAAGCAAGHDCGRASTAFLSAVNATLINHLPLLFGTALIVVPAILGIFWGAPLITRELEAGTHRLVWSQSVSRTRWLAIKLGAVRGSHGDRRAVQPAGHLVGRPHRRRQPEPAAACRLQRTRHRPGRLRRVRGRSRRIRRDAHPPDCPGHGGHARDLHRGPVRHARPARVPAGPGPPDLGRSARPTASPSAHGQALARRISC